MKIRFFSMTAFIKILLLSLCLIGATWDNVSADDEKTVPLGGSCIGVGVLSSDDYCGCTYGYVYYQGEAVHGAKVTLTFDNQSVETFTQVYEGELEENSHFQITGHNIGARKNDMITVTAEYLGQSVTRTFRAWPDGDRQKVHLVLGEGSWKNWKSGDYTRTLATLNDQTLLAGGLDGLLQVDMATDQEIPIASPWPDDIVVDSQERIWVTGNLGVGIYTDGSWETPDVPLTEHVSRIAITADGNRAWIADKSEEGNLAFFDGTSWSSQEKIGDYIVDLVLDDEQTLWVGTWKEGLFAIKEDGTRTHYSTEDGLAGNEIRDLLIAPYDRNRGQGRYELQGTEDWTEALWVGVKAIDSTDGNQGGIGIYDFEQETWHKYGQVDGLHSIVDPQDSSARGELYTRSLAVDPSGAIWAGTNGKGPYVLQDGQTWMRHPNWKDYRNWEDTRLEHLAALSTGIIAATNQGLLRLTFEPHTESLPSPQASEHSENGILKLSGSINAPSDSSIVNWYWTSDIDGPLCTTAFDCELPLDRISVGQHEITLRVQDSRGEWSPAIAAATVERVLYNLYLPAVTR